MVTLVGFAVWKLFIFYRTALCHCNEPFLRQSSKQQTLWYLCTLTELTWDKLRALLEAHTKNLTFLHSPLSRTFGLEVGAPSLYPLTLQPGWAETGTETSSCQKSWCFQISLCGKSERKVETSESKRKQSPNCRLQLKSECGQ